MDGAGVSSGSPAPLQTRWLRLTIQPSAEAVDKAGEPMSLGLPRSLCQILVCPSCRRWLIALDSAKASAPQRFWGFFFLVPFKSFEAFFFLLPVRSTVYSPRGDKADTASGWMDCSGAAHALAPPLNPSAPPQTIKYSFDGGTLYEDEGRIPSGMSI